MISLRPYRLPEGVSDEVSKAAPQQAVIREKDRPRNLTKTTFIPLRVTHVREPRYTQRQESPMKSFHPLTLRQQLPEAVWVPFPPVKPPTH